MSTRYVSRHAQSKPSRTERLRALGAVGPRTAAKSMVGVGLVVGAGALAIGPSAAEAESEPASASAAQTPTAAESLLANREADTGSRSAVRAAVTAPKSQGATNGFGSISVEAVEKPKPKPKPVETEQPAAETSDEQSTSETADTAQASESADSGESEQSSDAAPATGNYAAQAQAIGLGPTAQGVYSAVRTQFPHLSNIGGYRAGDPGDHGTGQAVDIMTNTADGDAVAAYLQANASSLGIKYIIWKQRIWLPGSDWRMMSDRGSATQNHYDHVHVSVN